MKILKKVVVVLESTAPTLINAMLAAKVDEIGGVTASGPRRTDQKDIEVAKVKLYRDANKQMGWPGINLGASLCEAGKHVQAKLPGKKKEAAITKASGQGPIPTLVVLKPFYPFDDRNELGDIPWEANVAPTRNPQTGGRNRTVRPLLPYWKCTVEHGFYTDISDATMLQLWQKAGEKAGLGDGRPSAPDKPLPIQHGTFRVLSFKVTEVVKIHDEVEIEYTPAARAALTETSGGGNGELTEPKPKNRLAAPKTDDESVVAKA